MITIDNTRFFPQILHLHIQPDHHLIRIFMLYKKNGLLKALLKLFGRFRGAKRHVRQNPIFHVFFPHFYSFANLSYLVSAYFIEYDLIIFLLVLLISGANKATMSALTSSWGPHGDPQRC